MFHGAVVGHDGTNQTQTFQRVAAYGAKLSVLDGVVDSTRRQDVAVYYDWESEWALKITSLGNYTTKEYFPAVLQYYQHCGTRILISRSLMEPPTFPNISSSWLQCCLCSNPASWNAGKLLLKLAAHSLSATFQDISMTSTSALMAEIQVVGLDVPCSEYGMRTLMAWLRESNRASPGMAIRTKCQIMRNCSTQRTTQKSLHHTTANSMRGPQQ